VNDLRLDDIVFKPFESEKDGEGDDLDPDFNFFETVSNLHCKYYREKEFISLHNNLTRSRSLSLLHHNIRSASKNLEQLIEYVTSLGFTFSVIGLSETWLQESTMDIYGIANYTATHQCRQGRRGGGVSLYVHNSIPYKERNDLLCNSDCIESVFIEFDGKMVGCQQNVIIGNIYRPPNTDINVFNECMSRILSTIKNENKLCYCMGDYNINILNNETHADTGKFLDLMYSHSFIPLITKPTRVCNDSATIIDNIFTNDILCNEDQTQGVLFTDVTDHFPVFVISNHEVKTDVCETRMKRCINANNISKFKQSLEHIDWNAVTCQEDAQLAYTTFSNIVVSLYEESFPVKTVKAGRRQCNPWISAGIKKSIRQKNKLYMAYKRRRTTYNEIRYKLFRNRLKHLIKAAKKSYYQDLLSVNKSNLKQSWRILKEMIGKRDHSKCNIDFLIDGEIVTDSKIIVNKFNEFYVNVGQKLAQDIPPAKNTPSEYLKGTYVNSLYFTPVVEEELNRIVKNLRNSAAGLDGLKPDIIKTVYPAFVQPLLHVLNQSFIQGIFPDELKSACVTPIFKGGDKMLVKNYRPVSVLPVFSKIFERVMYNRLMRYLEKHNILYQYQFGFKKNHSTYMALTLLIDKILNALDNNEHVLGLYLDFAKAFDTVDHNILLTKLLHYGVRGTMFKWFKSYLSKRTQIVKYNNTVSSPLFIKCGVPQGSILGPILFLLYINDLSTISDGLFTLMFADDTNMFIQGKDITQMEMSMNNEIEHIVEWLHCNKLSLNVDKTHTMLFTNNKKMYGRRNNVCIEGVMIETVSQTKFLGVIIDNKLSWKEHISYISNKISKGIGVIRKVKDLLNKDTLRTLYYTFIYPYLTYCNLIWGRAANVHLSRLFLLQKRIIRVICKTHFFAHSKPLFIECKVLDIYQINKYITGIFMFKYDKGLLPNIFDSMFSRQTDLHSYCTRHNKLFSLPLCRTQGKKNSLCYYGAYFWNNFVHTTIGNRSTFTLFSFKKALKQSLI